MYLFQSKSLLKSVGFSQKELVRKKCTFYGQKKEGKNDYIKQ